MCGLSVKGSDAITYQTFCHVCVCAVWLHHWLFIEDWFPIVHKLEILMCTHKNSGVLPSGTSGGNLELVGAAYSQVSPMVTGSRDAVESGLVRLVLLTILWGHWSTGKAMSLLSPTLCPVQVKTKAKQMATLRVGGLHRKRSDSPFWDYSKYLANMFIWKLCFLET